MEFVIESALLRPDAVVDFGAAEARLAADLYRKVKRARGRELDLAIAEAVLIGPTGWGASVGRVPAAGTPPRVAANIEKLGEFRDAVRGRRENELAGLLAAEAEFIVGERPRRGAPSGALRRPLPGDAR